MALLELAVAKCNKYATRESGDTVEIIESPLGGFVVLLADGQGSGGPAKLLSQQAVGKAIALLKDGAPLDVVARLVHAQLYLYRGGKVSVTLILIAVEASGRMAQISRSGDAPAVLVNADGATRLLDDYAATLGVGQSAPASFTEVPLTSGSYLVAYSDGLLHAGAKFEQRLNLPPLVASYTAAQPSAEVLADRLLQLAVERDRGFPADDMSVAVVHLTASPTGPGPLTRRMLTSVPLAE